MARERRVGGVVSGDGKADVDVPLPRGGGPSVPPHLLTANRPFVWLVLGDSFAQLARWGFFLAVIGDAKYRLDADPAQTALLIGAYSVPLVIVSPLYGAAADRWSAKRLLLFMSLAAVPLPLIAFNTDSIGPLYVCAALYGLVFAAVIPSRGALVPRLVPGDQLVRANGMISGVGSVQMIIGPGVAALLAATGGPRAPYFVTLVAAAVAAVLFLRVPDRRAEGPRRDMHLLADLGTGFSESWRERAIRRIFLLDICVWFLVAQLVTLEPSYIEANLGMGQVFLGLVWTVFGVGELIGSLLLTRIREGAGREFDFAARGLLLAAVGFLLYVAIESPVTAILANVVFGVGFPLFVGSSNALIQRVADHPGKVSAAFAMVGEASPVLSSVLITVAGATIPVRLWLLVSGGIFAVVATVALWISRSAR